MFISNLFEYRTIIIKYIMLDAYIFNNFFISKSLLQNIGSEATSMYNRLECVNKEKLT